MDWGNVPIGAVIPFHFGTYGGTNGESLTASGLAASDIEIYKDGSITQRSSDAGYTLIDTDGLDIDSMTGAHGFTVDTGDNTDAGFFAAGSFYIVWVSAITVDSQTVRFIAGTFRLVAAEGTAGVPKVDVARVNNTAQTAGDLAAMLTTIDDFLDTEIAAILAAVDTEIAAIITTLGTPAGASLAADLVTIDNFVDDLESRLSSTLAAKLAAHAAGVLIFVVDAGSDATHIVFKTVEGTTASATNDFYNGAVAVFTSGALAGQRVAVTDYVGASKTATVTSMTGTPAENVTGVLA